MRIAYRQPARLFRPDGRLPSLVNRKNAAFYEQYEFPVTKGGMPMKVHHYEAA